MRTYLKLYAVERLILQAGNYREMSAHGETSKQRQDSKDACSAVAIKEASYQGALTLAASAAGARFRCTGNPRFDRPPVSRTRLSGRL